MYRFTSALIRGRLIKRYKRFLADVMLENGDVITAHCPNTGAMTGCAHEGVEVYLSQSNNPKRKYAYTWEYSSDLDGNKIGVNTANANRIVKSAIANKQISEFAHYSQCFAETKFGDSRIDFMLQEDGAPDAYIEVKSVTLAHNTTAMFPDTVTKRGTKHCHELVEIIRQGHRAALLFCIQRENITDFKVAKDIDPKYFEAFEYAQKNGVEILVYTCKMTQIGVELKAKVAISS
ncbi:DNA/RNA nuclease SfsA [Glaciecola sp. XM2]|uniref:DNA/RNA nuclease SfsA n=1 Tax=Glaciecola sp. XM2 TaxID=1914931 RepID=UPI001BDEBBD5|nr:DNA/RNA nuclease SfsA [Glaciecola sp. XM2]MBT1452165.1 DNA/RNA nuclease SfsA [Glaciecola sp. XM2]